MSRIPSRQVPASPGALSPDARMPGDRSTYFFTHATPTAQPLAAYVPPIFTQMQHNMPRAPSSSSTTASSAASGSSLLTAETLSTSITHLSSFASPEKPASPASASSFQRSGSDIVRPGPAPLQADPGPSGPSRHGQSDPGQASMTAPSRSTHGSASGFAPRRQTLPGETTTAFGRPRPFNLSQPPRSHRNSSPRSSASRVLWGREGLPVRLYDTRHAPAGPSAPAPNISLSSHQGPPRVVPQQTRQSITPGPYAHQPTHMQPPVAQLQAMPRPPLMPGLVGSGALGGGTMSMPPGHEVMSQGHRAEVVSTPLNPLNSSLTRDAMLAHAHKLYESPAPNIRAPSGLTARPLEPETNVPGSTDPMQVYNAELLPLLKSLRALHPNHIPTALLLSCVQYAVKDYDGSLRTSHEILALNPNFVESMSNIATTLRAVGNSRDAEQWWMRAIHLRPSYWDAIENLTATLCNPSRPMDTNVSVEGDQPRYSQALAVCEFVLGKLVPGPTILSSLSTGSVRVGETHRLQNLLYTRGNLKFVIASSSERAAEPNKEFAGIEDQFAAIELMLNRRPSNESGSSHVYLTTHDLLLGLAVSALRVTGNLPYIPSLESDGSNMDILFRIHASHQAVLDAIAPNGILPLVLIKPENIFTMMTELFPSTKGLLPGVVYEAGNLNLDAIPPVLPPGSTNASRMTATVLLTLAKHCQEAARRGSVLPGPLELSGRDAPAIRASLSAALLLYYCALALFPSASVCNNLGILLSTLAGVRITCLAQVPGTLLTTHPKTEILTGPILARMYYQQGLLLDPNHPHLLTNIGSLLKDEGELEEAIRMYSRALEIKPDFDVALANMANATRDAGKLIESIEYYRRAVLANPYFPESIVGLANALESVCDWQGRGGLTMELYLDVTGAIIARSDDRVDSRAPGFLDKLIEICDSQIINGYHSSTGIIASDRSLEQWMETIEACLGRLSQTRRTRWEVFLGRFYAPFDRAENRVYEAGSVVRLIEMLSRVLQRRWYVDMYGSATYSPKGKSRELDISKYYRPKLPTAMVAPLAPSILPFHTFTLPLSTRRIRIIAHRNAIRTSYLALSQDWLPPHVYQPPPPPTEGKLKIGYISSDFNNHPLGHLMQSVFQFHNSERFEIYCYATTESDGSTYRSKIEMDAHHFVNVTSWSTQAVVEQVHRDGIHILVNLNGYTKGARNDIFAVRPAPIIISLMGFAGTLASGWSDYLITDPHVGPVLGSALDLWRARWKQGEETSQTQAHFPELSREHNFDIDLDPESISEDWMFSEKLIVMPHTCFVTDHKQSFRGDDRENVIALRGRSPTPDLIWKFEEIRRHKLRRELFPDIADDWIIYANFNQLYKVDPIGLDAWLRVLARTPKSILWLLRFPAAGERNILRCAELWAGPDMAARIRFTDVAPKEKHIERCRVADLFLDTIECGAHTVATDVLWVGTPIVTWPRHKMCSRIAASIASATGYGRHMVVSCLKDYEDRAVDLAKSLTFVAASDDHGGWYRQCRGALSDLRRNLYLNRDTMPLFDTARWTRNVERAYMEVWRRWETGTEFEGSEEWLACTGEEKETACIRVRED